MSVELPEEWEWLWWVANWIIGAGDFPKGDEDAMWAVAALIRAAARDLRNLEADASATMRKAGQAFDTGSSHEALAAAAGRLTGADGALSRLAEDCDRQAELLEGAATEVQHTKLVVIGTLAVAAVEMAAVVGTGLGAIAGASAVRAVARASIRAAMRELITRLWSLGGARLVAVVAARSAVSELLEEAGIDWSARVVQRSWGTRRGDDFGWWEVARSGGAGAVGGAAAGGLLGTGIASVADRVGTRMAGVLLGTAVRAGAEVLADVSATFAVTGELSIDPATLTSAVFGGIQHKLHREPSEHELRRAAPEPSVAGYTWSQRDAAVKNGHARRVVEPHVDSNGSVGVSTDAGTGSVVAPALGHVDRSSENGSAVSGEGNDAPTRVAEGDDGTRVPDGGATWAAEGVPAQNIRASADTPTATPADLGEVVRQRQRDAATVGDGMRESFPAEPTPSNGIPEPMSAVGDRAQAVTMPDSTAIDERALHAERSTRDAESNANKVVSRDSLSGSTATQAISADAMQRALAPSVPADTTSTAGRAPPMSEAVDGAHARGAIVVDRSADSVESGISPWHNGSDPVAEPSKKSSSVEWFTGSPLSTTAEGRNALPLPGHAVQRTPWSTVSTPPWMHTGRGAPRVVMPTGFSPTRLGVSERPSSPINVGDIGRSLGVPPLTQIVRALSEQVGPDRTAIVFGDSASARHQRTDDPDPGPEDHQEDRTADVERPADSPRDYSVRYGVDRTALVNSPEAGRVFENLRGDGYHDVIVHGDDRGRPRLDGPDDIQSIIDAIRANPAYDSGTPIRLVSCASGADGGWAQRIADEFGVDVVAPTGRVGTKASPGSSVYVEDGTSWVVFHPADQIRSGSHYEPLSPPKAIVAEDPSGIDWLGDAPPLGWSRLDPVQTKLLEDLAHELDTDSNGWRSLSPNAELSPRIDQSQTAEMSEALQYLPPTACVATISAQLNPKEILAFAPETEIICSDLIAAKWTAEAYWDIDQGAAAKLESMAARSVLRQAARTMGFYPKNWEVQFVLKSSNARQVGDNPLPDRMIFDRNARFTVVSVNHFGTQHGNFAYQIRLLEVPRTEHRDIATSKAGLKLRRLLNVAPYLRSVLAENPALSENLMSRKKSLKLLKDAVSHVENAVLESRRTIADLGDEPEAMNPKYGKSFPNALGRLIYRVGSWLGLVELFNGATKVPTVFEPSPHARTMEQETAVMGFKPTREDSGEVGVEFDTERFIQSEDGTDREVWSKWAADFDKNMGELKGIISEVADGGGWGYKMRKDMKTFERAQAKLATFGISDFRHGIFDFIAGRIMVRTFDEAYRAVGSLNTYLQTLAEKSESSKYAEPWGVKDILVAPRASGYRDLKAWIKLSSGHIAEVQIHVKAISKFEDIQHPLYEICRSYVARVKGGGTLTMRETALFERLNSVSLREFNKAAEKSGLKRSDEEPTP